MSFLSTFIVVHSSRYHLERNSESSCGRQVSKYSVSPCPYFTIFSASDLNAALHAFFTGYTV